MIEVRYVFGRRQVQDLPGYASGPGDPFVFTVSGETKPETWYSAYALLAFYRDDFLKACAAARTSSQMRPIEERDTWIPSCYLDTPTIEVGTSGEMTELLRDNARPNPWLSLAN